VQLKPQYEVKLVAENGQHFYTVDKDPTYYPGVTGILDMISKPALVPWSAKCTAEYCKKIIHRVNGKQLSDRFLETLVKRAKKQPKFIKETSASVGTDGHSLFDKAIKTGEPMTGSPYAESFNYWRSKEKLKIVAGDHKVMSIQFGYGGSFDALAVDEKGEYVIIDFKTGNNIYETHALQVAAYSQAFMETYASHGRPNGVIVRLIKDRAQYERREVRNIHDSFDAFSSALDLKKSMDLVHFTNRELIKDKKIKEKVK
jgi:hypothetical protein